ncbi:MAG: hypothetical protein EXR77_15550 [Myxococcales bacterium]|nr:hypothetical protein [Myxococcales bacterium]
MSSPLGATVGHMGSEITIAPVTVVSVVSVFELQNKTSLPSTTTCPAMLTNGAQWEMPPDDIAAENVNDDV